MAGIEELRTQFAELQRRLSDQAEALQQARTEQREALSLAKAVIEQQTAEAKKPPTIYVPRERKVTEFGGFPTRPGDITVEEWVKSVKAALRVLRVPEEDHVDFIEEHLKGQAKATVKFMAVADKKDVEKVFELLLKVYGDKVPIGTRLKEFFERKQEPGETVRAYAYDLQERMSKVERRDPQRVPDPDTVLKEQLVLGLRDDSLRREMKRRFKEEPSKKFHELMQAAIMWSEEEEVPVAEAAKPNPHTRSGGLVNAAAGEKVLPQTELTLESLSEAVQKLAVQQGEMLKVMTELMKKKNPISMPKYPRAPGSRRAPLKDELGRYICYTCERPGHTSRECPLRRRTESQALETNGAPGAGGPSTVEGQAVAEGFLGLSFVENPSAYSVERNMGSASISSDFCKRAFGDCLTAEVCIAGVKTRCLLDTGSEVTTITESHFQKYLKDKDLTMHSTRFVRLTAVNGLAIPVVGCLEADIEYMGQTLPGKCIFILKDKASKGSHIGEGVPGILGMNIISELKELLLPGEGTRKMNCHEHSMKNAVLSKVLAREERQSLSLGPTRHMGNGKVGRERKTIIPPWRGKILDEHSCVPGNELQVTKEKGGRVTFLQERCDGRLQVPVQAARQGRIPAHVANIRALPEKHQEVFSKNEMTNYDDQVKGHHDRLKTAWKVALRTTKDRAQSRKGTYDSKSSGALIRSGDCVPLRSRRRRRCNKIQDKWKPNPPIVVTHNNPELPVYANQPERGGPGIVVHRDQLKHCTLSPDRDHRRHRSVRPEEAETNWEMVLVPQTEYRGGQSGANPNPNKNGQILQTDPVLPEDRKIENMGNEPPVLGRSQRANKGVLPVRLKDNYVIGSM
ncbi:uncharacterized protein LOC135975608 [Chrysemys picta bellii]|uniref:uncharacterized protein LOC135975608 n=1 Tax=Chrysemys picta bellii TaxID=8478 RepID=UPI0032B24D9E